MKLLHKKQFSKREKINKNYHHDWSNEHTEEEGAAGGKKDGVETIQKICVVKWLSLKVETCDLFQILNWQG